MNKYNFDHIDEPEDLMPTFKEHEMKRIIREARTKIVKQPVIPESNHYVQEDDGFRTYKRDQEIQTVGPLGFPYKF